MIKEPDTLMLVGFMGAGKTTVGKEIARQHHSQFIDIDSDEKYQSDVKNIESWIKDNGSKRESLKTIKIKQEQYKQYNEQIKSLISLGVNIIDENHTDICPLCNTKQDTYEILKHKVLNNPLLNTLEKDLLAI